MKKIKKIILFCLLVSIVFGWEKMICITAYDAANDIIQLSNGGFAFCGVSTIDYPRADVFVAATDIDGNIIWSREFGTDEMDIGRELISIDDTTFVVVGTTMDYGYRYVLRFNIWGDTLWTFRDTASIKGDNIDINHEGMILTSGDLWYLGYTPEGERIWESYRPFYPYGLLNNIYDIRCLHQRPFGYVAVGNAVIDDDDAAMALYTDEGDTTWLRHFGHSYWDLFNAVCVIDNPNPGQPRGFLAVGETNDALCCTTLVYAVRTDMDGNMLWERYYCHQLYTHTGLAHGKQIGYDVIPTRANDYQVEFTILANTAYPESLDAKYAAWLITVSDTLGGDTVWTKTYDTFDQIYPKAIYRCSDGGFVMSGKRAGSARGETNFWLCRVDSLGNHLPYSIEEPHVPNTPLPKQLEVTVFPNPFNSSCQIDIPQGFTASIYDVYGRQVHTISSSASIWNAEGQPSGVYLVRAQKGDVMVEKRGVLIK